MTLNPPEIRGAANAGRSERRWLALLVAAALLVYWVGNARAPLWDRDEPRFAEAAREMLATGDWIVPHFGGEVRYDKPVLGYYPIAVGMAVFGENQFGARFFSGLFGALAVVLTFLLARRITGDGARALLAAGILAFSPVMVAESKLCTVDALLFVWLLLAFTGLWRIYEGPCGAGWKALFWAALALAMLTKGPVAIAAVFAPVALLAVFARDRSFLKRLGWLWGVPLFIAVCLPWAIAVQWKTSGEFLRVALGKHVVGRSAAPLEGHRGFYGFYLVTLVATFFPWFYFLPGSIKLLVKGQWNAKVDLFLVSWCVGPIVVLELVQTKMVHYSLPIFPALSILVSSGVSCARETKYRCDCAKAPVLGASVAALFFAAGPPIAAWYAGLGGAVLPLCVAGAVLMAGMSVWLLRARDWGGMRFGVAAAFAWLLVMSAWALPAVAAQGLAAQVVPLADKALADVRADMKAFPQARVTGDPRVVLFGCEEPSLVFYLKAELPPKSGTLSYLINPEPKVAVVSSRSPDIAGFLAAHQYAKAGDVSAFNFAKGRSEDVSVWRPSREWWDFWSRIGETNPTGTDQ